MLILSFQMGMCPSQFWDLTPFEFSIACKAFDKTCRRQLELLAWTQANFMNCWTKKKVTVRKLLGAKDLPRDKAAIAEHFRSKREKFGRV